MARAARRTTSARKDDKPKVDPVVKGLVIAINGMEGGLRQRYSAALVQEAMNALGDDASRKQLRQWIDQNRPPMPKSAGGTPRTSRQRDLAKKIVLDNWDALKGDSDSIELPTDLSLLGQHLVKYYRNTFAPDAPTIEVRGVEYVALGTMPVIGQKRTLSVARWNGQQRTKATSTRQATKVAVLTDIDFKKLFPRQAAWEQLLAEATSPLR